MASTGITTLKILTACSNKHRVTLILINYGSIFQTVLFSPKLCFACKGLGAHHHHFSFLSKCKDHSFIYTSEMAIVIKLQIYLTRKANICFHLADNMNSNVFILLNKALTRTEFSNAYFVPLCIDSMLNCIF